MVAFDLDGTLAESEYPQWTIGPPIKETVELLKGYHSKGYVITIFTARPAEHRTRIWRWLELNGLSSLIYQVITDKPEFGLLVDDRSYNPPWLTTPQSKTK